MRPEQAGTGLSEALPPGRRELALALQDLRHRLREHSAEKMTLARLAQLLAERDWRIGEGQLSRYFNGRKLPSKAFIRRLHSLACEVIGDDGAVGIREDELVKIHAAAEPWICRACAELRQENRSLQEELRQIRTGQAGLAASPGEPQGNPAQLPVPVGGGDRQLQADDAAMAEQLASRAAMLYTQGDVAAALSLLQEGSEVLTPFESAVAVALLRRGNHSTLANTLITIYGRERPESDVIHAGWELHRSGMPDYAGSMLKAAMGRAPA
ncbi:hypothetical protein [Saccharothrix sp. ST-888]|uniref:hypothetical protein n=1 Tax=Saccharothrix sp. ST-888 TaxID=1427391 RepID=UPI0005EC1D07|nr:hypothetical protein [Saccharothrix sp. ST-888]KJK55186.1 hypothetical protein UK12_30215 [Saccharothrix sp. ST-888]